MFESATRQIWWLPSFGFFLFLAIEAWMFVSPSHIFADPGVGRHLRTAEAIVETGEVPRTDPLSWTKAGQPWTDYEWGFETAIGEVYRAGGLPFPWFCWGPGSRFSRCRFISRRDLFCLPICLWRWWWRFGIGANIRCGAIG